MGSTMQYKHKCLLPNTQKKLQTSCIMIDFVLLERWRVCIQNLNDTSIDLKKFPASKVRHLAKKMEASEATAYHIKQVASDPKAAQINLMRHQCTDLQPSKNKKKQSFKSRPLSHKWYSNEHQHQVQPYSKLEIGKYTTDTVNLVGSCIFYLVHPDTKHLQEVTFQVASNNGSVLLSCTTMLVLGLIQPNTRLDYLHPRASLITSSADHPKKTKFQVNIHLSKKESTVSTVSNWQVIVHKPITSKDQILAAHPDVFDGIGCFPGSPYHIQLYPNVTPKQTPCWPVPVYLKKPFKEEIDKMLQAGVLKPVCQATPWINSFVLVEGKISFASSRWEYVWILPIWIKL